MERIQDQLQGHLIFTDGSVLSDPRSSAAACVALADGITLQCQLPFHGSSTAAELAGLHLAADHLATTLPEQPVMVITDSRPALQVLQSPKRSGITVAVLHTKLTPI
ncbi:hypothetical protein HPB50_025890 [Hyalomma asiaticum]|uniref:Uncharacterized protein n=1 Tax=Hyalomma asiaticum TaxID=266040 RepID=A0ACB7TP59_HYAAI|nr:hypothetical protein HPB50_025890 [Hyalomma asiaticum]